MKHIRFVALLLALSAIIPAVAAGSHGPRVKFRTTVGSFTVELFDDTPLHRDNFLRLVREGYYDGVLFHRVIRQFMVQGGDPDSRTAQPGQELGEGGPGYKVEAEFRLPARYHVRGALAAARESDEENPRRASSGSQFYIVTGKKFSEQELLKVRRRVLAATQGQAPLTAQMVRDYREQGGAPHLDGQYTVFGRVVSGMRTVARIEAAATDGNDRPLTDIRILSVRVK